MKENPNTFLPLAPATLHILLALAGEDLHGYGIMLEVSRQSEDRYKLGPGTLYDNLQRLLEQGLVQEVRHTGGDDSRRRYYRLNALGRSVLAAEIARLEDVVRDGRLRLQSPHQGERDGSTIVCLAGQSPPTSFPGTLRRRDDHNF